ncbi:D-amino-acid oxidase-like protein [Zalerion maritima]|uniref:D-amino-acid oxidase-like protein n=1 Tax=Zalerion maritima TaxID=339359 RepID=A0AAD5RQY1_9PEZI|nr:D-amino-acid oxidase-like protein [Zalerion maritima]
MLTILTDCRVLRRQTEMESSSSNPLSEALFSPSPWYKDLMPGFRELSGNELAAHQAPTIHSGCEFTSVCINTATYLQWLVGRCLASGVALKRCSLSHVASAANLHHSGSPASIVVNCSGLLASRLGGVMDASVTPGRGQIVLVRNSARGLMTTTSGTDDGADELLYIMERAAGGGTILGGTYMKGNWNPNPDPNIANRIMKRAVEFCPELTGGKGVEGLDVIRHGVGFRPVREGGVRLEGEKMDGGLSVVHNYGHAGWGYQGSYGCAERVVELVDDALRAGKEKAKL